MTQIAGVLFVGLGWLMPAIPWTIVGLIWAYDLVWMVLMDLAKLLTYQLIEHRVAHHLQGFCACFTGRCTRPTGRRQMP